MRKLLLAVLFVGQAQAATVYSNSRIDSVRDTLNQSSFACYNPSVLLGIKEQIFSAYSTGDNSAVVKSLVEGACFVTDLDLPIIVNRVLTGKLIGIGGVEAIEILVNIRTIDGKILWTESVNLKDSAERYELLKESIEHSRISNKYR